MRIRDGVLVTLGAANTQGATERLGIFDDSDVTSVSFGCYRFLCADSDELVERSEITHFEGGKKCRGVIVADVEKSELCCAVDDGCLCEGQKNLRTVPF